MFMKSFPKMTFYRFIKNFIDVQTFYARVYTAAPQTGLAKVTEKVFGKKLCKVEQCLNWERLPLRESQKHYGDSMLTSWCNSFRSWKRKVLRKAIKSINSSKSSIKILAFVRSLK